MNKPSQKKLGNAKNLILDLQSIVAVLSSRRRTQLAFMACLQLICGMSEVVSLGALLPFISALSNPNRIFQNEKFSFLLDLFAIEEVSDLIITASAVFILSFIFVNLLKLFTFFVQNKMSVSIGADFSTSFFRQLVHQDLNFFVNSNSSVLTSRSINDLNATTGYLKSALMIVTQVFAIFAIVVALFFINPSATSLIFFITALCYVAIGSFSKRQLLDNGLRVSNSRSIALQQMHIAIAGIRELILLGSQTKIIDRYSKADRSFRLAGANSQLIAALPRFLLEVIGATCLIAVAAYFALKEDGIFGALPMVAAMALATVRILPASQMIYSNYASMQTAHISVRRCLELLDLSVKELRPISNSTPIQVPKKSIELENLWFRYKRSDDSDSPAFPWILKGVSLTIPVGKVTALVGRTGSGKTTISDVLLGFHTPDEGTLKADGLKIDFAQVAEWRKLLAAVPQNVFLLDATLLENIALESLSGEVDLPRAQRAMENAQLTEFIEGTENGIFHVIGENGLRLSGGQRQRVGIARALYRDKPVLIMDESTSSLDNKTESSILSSIRSWGEAKTIVCVAHRLDTIKRADLIYVIDQGKVKNHGTFESLRRNCPVFRDIVQVNDR